MFKRLILIMVLGVCLSGCKQKEIEEVAVEPPPISTQAEYGMLDTFTVEAIGSVCGFNNVDGGLKIYPHYNNSAHILMKKILISDNDFWDTILKSQSEDFILTQRDKYTLITTPTGVTYGYFPIDEEWAILGSTEGLNSGYLTLVMDCLWKQNT